MNKKRQSQKEGAQSQGLNPYSHNVDVFKRELKKDPNNAQNIFYLAQSYRDAGELKEALYRYRERSEMDGWDEEVWCSLFQVALLLEKLKHEPGEIIEAYLAAYDFRPQRAESLTELARFYRERKQYRAAHMFSREAVSTPRPSDTLFVDESVYQWRAVDEHAVSAYWVGHYEESRQLCQVLLNSGFLPDNQVNRVTENLKFAEGKLGVSSSEHVPMVEGEIVRKIVDDARKRVG